MIVAILALVVVMVVLVVGCVVTMVSSKINLNFVKNNSKYPNRFAFSSTPAT